MNFALPMLFEMLVTVVVLVLSVWLTRRFCNAESWFYVLDYPNERSLHVRPTPRTGGVAIVVGILTGFALLALQREAGFFLLWLAVSTVVISLFSYLDDRRGLSVRLRLLGHLISAGILVASGLGLSFAGIPGITWAWPAWLGLTLSIFFLIWMANLYNFMDGMDGFAGGMAVIGFGTFALLGYLAGSQLFAAVGLVIAAASGGFLFFNFPPARIFMGDTGSSVLGLLAGAMILWAARDALFPIWVGLLVFSPFIADATITLTRRLLCREQVWKAHKTHYYQRLVQLGWGHSKTVLAEYGLMLMCSLSAVLMQYLGIAWQAGLLVAWCLVYSGLVAGVTRLEKE